MSQEQHSPPASDSGPKRVVFDGPARPTYVPPVVPEYSYLNAAAVAEYRNRLAVENAPSQPGEAPRAAGIPNVTDAIQNQVDAEAVAALRSTPDSNTLESGTPSIDTPFDRTELTPLLTGVHLEMLSSATTTAEVREIVQAQIADIAQLIALQRTTLNSLITRNQAGELDAKIADKKSKIEAYLHTIELLQAWLHSTQL